MLAFAKSTLAKGEAVFCLSESGWSCCSGVHCIGVQVRVINLPDANGKYLIPENYQINVSLFMADFRVGYSIAAMSYLLDESIHASMPAFVAAVLNGNCQEEARVYDCSLSAFL